MRRTDHAGVTDRLLLTKPEAAERLGVSIRTVERLVAGGRLPQLHVGRAVRLRVSDLEAYVQSAECGVGDVTNRSSR
jgi:excisionase family DNA binding protein